MRFLSVSVVRVLDAVARGFEYGFAVIDATGLRSGTVYPTLARRGLLADVVMHGVALAGAGIAIGLATASLASRGLQRLVFGITPTGPSSYVGVAAGLFAVALLATWWPAWRASRVDPIHALRAD